MGGYQFTRQAVDDLFEIWSYIAGDDLEAANRVEEAIYARMQLPGGCSSHRPNS
jgi:plasmid stabilization system protein ParE